MISLATPNIVVHRFGPLACITSCLPLHDAQPLHPSTHPAQSGCLIRSDACGHGKLIDSASALCSCQCDDGWESPSDGDPFNSAYAYCSVYTGPLPPPPPLVGPPPPPVGLAQPPSPPATASPPPGDGAAGAQRALGALMTFSPDPLTPFPSPPPPIAIEPSTGDAEATSSSLPTSALIGIGVGGLAACTPGGKNGTVLVCQ